MKLSTEKFSKEIQKILNEEGISPERLAVIAGIHYSTIYRILRKEKPTAQVGIAKLIAEATGR
jgi:predicted transcriptional regulator